MAVLSRCAHCGAGTDYLQAGLDSSHCLNCGWLTGADRTQVPREPVFEGGHDPAKLRPI